MNLRLLCHFSKDDKLMKRIVFLEMEWKRAYPNVDLDKQASWAHAWLVTHPEKKYKDFARFLNNWFKNSEKRFAETGYVTQKTSTYKEEIPPEEEIMTGEDFARMREAIRRPQ